MTTPSSPRTRWLLPTVVTTVLLSATALGVVTAWRGAVPASNVVGLGLDPSDPLLGRRAYALCQGCHQPDGRGIAGNYPALIGSPVLTGPAVGAIATVLHGYDSSATPAQSRWNERMPGFATQLADHELAAVLTWSRQQWGNAASPIDATTVAQVRAALTARTTPWTPDELQTLEKSR